eukprot:201779-Chlamydomonas_euryale.AAC.1
MRVGHARRAAWCAPGGGRSCVRRLRRPHGRLPAHLPHGRRSNRHGRGRRRHVCGAAVTGVPRVPPEGAAQGGRGRHGHLGQVKQTGLVKLHPARTLFLLNSHPGTSMTKRCCSPPSLCSPRMPPSHSAAPASLVGRHTASVCGAHAKAPTPCGCHDLWQGHKTLRGRLASETDARV